MENERTSQHGSRPLDGFDPSGDGHQPHTLAEVIQRGQDVLDSIDRFEAAMYGCMTPLNFRTEKRELSRLRERAAEMLAPISKARDIIERDLPLATTTALEAEHELHLGAHGRALGNTQPGRHH